MISGWNSQCGREHPREVVCYLHYLALAPSYPRLHRVRNMIIKFFLKDRRLLERVSERDRRLRILESWHVAGYS